MTCPPVAYWKISLCSSSCSTMRHFIRYVSHWRRSLNMNCIISKGVASISVVHRHSRNGCPSPTFRWATSMNGSNVCIVIQPRDFSRPSLIVELVHSYKYLWLLINEVDMLSICNNTTTRSKSKLVVSTYPRQSWTCNPSPSASRGTGFDSSI